MTHQANLNYLMEINQKKISSNNELLKSEKLHQDQRIRLIDENDDLRQSNQTIREQLQDLF